MIIKTLVENTAVSTEYRKRNGLSFYIQTKQHKILFDLGPDDSFLHNAKKMQINISDIDTVIISHGHSDHGGALKFFLEHNNKATVYIHKNAFEPHYIKLLFLKKNVGLEKSLENNSRIMFVDGQYKIDEELFVFSKVEGRKLLPQSNRTLCTKRNNETMQDDFSHEQNLLIVQDGVTTLFSGCSHNGIVNIVEEAFNYANSVDFIIASFHTFLESKELIMQVAQELKKYDTKYLTCHCTGQKAFSILKEILGDKVSYLSTGTSITI